MSAEKQLNHGYVFKRDDAGYILVMYGIFWDHPPFRSIECITAIYITHPHYLTQDMRTLEFWSSVQCAEWKEYATLEELKERHWMDLL